jgi:hypothetical protein
MTFLAVLRSSFLLTCLLHIYLLTLPGLLRLLYYFVYLTSPTLYTSILHLHLLPYSLLRFTRQYTSFF